MSDYLRPILSENDLQKLSSLALAHIGDCVFEQMVRNFSVINGAETSKSMHTKTVSMVKAAAQAKDAKLIIPILTKEEAAVFQRGRNSKPKTIPKNAKRCDYLQSTALETLFGWLYLKGCYDRINELFEMIAKNEKEEDLVFEHEKKS